MNLSFIDWVIVLVVFIGMVMTVNSTKGLMKSVTDFLSAGRAAGRYLLSISGGIAGLGAISTVMFLEMGYIAGFSLSWWGLSQGIILLFLTMSGWVIYRFRSTRCLTLSQFFEKRYSRKFRIFTGIVAFTAGLINFGIFPAVGAQFFMQFCGLPENAFGLPVFPLVMILLLSIALYFVYSGGQIAVIIADFFQGIFAMFVLLIVVLYLFFTVSWDQVSEALEQTFLEKLKLEAYRSYSESINDDAYYDFAFSEQFAFDSSTYNRSIEKVQQIAKNDTSRTILNSYNYWTNKSSEKETATGLDFKYDFRLSNVISGNLKFGVKQRKKKRSFDRHNEYGIVNKAAGAKEQRDSLVSFFNLGSFILDGQDGNIPLTAFIDENYNGSDFYNGDYDFDAVADLDKMMEVYDYFSENWNKSNSNTNIDEYVMHHVHQTNSQMYDYRGDEEYSASYFMADFDISSQFNIVAGGRTETNKTTYYSLNSLDHALPHWIFVGDTTKHERKNSYFFPALFLNYKPTKYLSIRYAKTNTLTRPDYTSLIPLTRATGNGNSLDWRNKFLKPGLSQNTDLSVSLIEDKLGLLTVGYFKKSIKDLIYSSGQRVLFTEDTARFNLSSNYVNYTIGNYELNNPSKIDLSGFEIDYQTRFWYLPGALNGLVFNANYTVATSTVKYPRTVVSNYFDFDTFTFIQENNDTTYVDRLLDQPDKILNVSVGYDYKGFSGRLSMLYNDNVFVSTNFWPEKKRKYRFILKI
ncbi:hypothetical protein N9N24_04070 [Candidatus Marinimicrobia bacterium]|nr:hypothetical protein [Candidatus Neomarinimicrobiota bacterium]